MRELFSDLDRTLIRTDEIAGGIWQVLAQRFPEVLPSAEEAYAAMPNYFVRSGDDNYYYDWAKQVASLGLSLDQATQAVTESELADGRLEYPGVAQLMDCAQRHGVETKILTYGADNYQRLKVALCPSLRGVEVIVTLQPKGGHFTSGQKAILFDDKPIGDSLPSGVEFVQSVEYNGIEPPERHTWRTAHSLGHFCAVLEEIVRADN